MKAVLRRMLDESEFLSDYGVKAVSRYHLEKPVHVQALICLVRNQLLGINAGLNDFRDQAGPASLMRGANSSTIISVEIFMKVKVVSENVDRSTVVRSGQGQVGGPFRSA